MQSFTQIAEVGMLRNGKCSSQTWPSPGFPRPRFMRSLAHFPQGALFPSSGPTRARQQSPLPHLKRIPEPQRHEAATPGKRRDAQGQESFARIHLPEKAFGLKASNPRRKEKAKLRRGGQSPAMQGPTKQRRPRASGV